MTELTGLERDLTTLLEKAVQQATFLVPAPVRFPEAGLQCTGSQLRQVYYASKGFARRNITAAQTQIKEGLLAELADSLRSFLRNYIHNERIGLGLTLVAGGKSNPQISEYAQDLVRAAAILGPEELVQLLCDWERGTPIQYKTCAVLSGISVTEPLMMDGGIRFVELPKSSDALANELPDGISIDVEIMRMAGATKLIMDTQCRPSLYKPGGTWPDHQETWAYGSLGPSLDSLCDALSLVTNNRVRSLTYWFDFSPLDVLGAGSGYTLPRGDEFSSRTCLVTQEELDLVTKLLPKFLPGGQLNDNVTLAIRRWGRSKQQIDIEDSFIDLRIALEALYLKGIQDELGFRLATRGAWHLGANFEEGFQYRETLHKAYSQASRIVHASTVAITEETRELLANAQDLCRRGILKRLDEGREPDWNALILGKELDAAATNDDETQP